MGINNILTYGTLAVILFFMIAGFRKGIAGSLADLIGYAAGFVFAPVLKIVIEPILKPVIINVVYLIFGSALNAHGGDALAIVNAAADMSKKFTDMINGAIGMSIERFAQIVLYVFSFLIISAAVSMILRWTNILEALPFVGHLSRLLGCGFGFLVSLLYIQAAVWAVNFLYESCAVTQLGTVHQGISGCMLLQVLSRISIVDLIFGLIK